jgi:starch synthase
MIGGLMYIIHIAAEVAPIAKVGGLADVVHGLCHELSSKGHQVSIVLPKYDCINIEDIHDLTVVNELYSFFEGEWFLNTIWSGYIDNIKVYFIESHHPRYFFNRGCFYGCEDDIDRFLYFSRAAIEFIYKLDQRPDIIHLHDWQTAIIAPLYKKMYHALGFVQSKIVLTLHNLEYQGKCSANDLYKIGLHGSYYSHSSQLGDPLYPDLINLLKGGILYADFVTTVSPTYAKEVLEPLEGKGLEVILRDSIHKFKGILNGLDYSYWNPETDKFLPSHFCPRELPLHSHDKHTLDNKAFVKKSLRERLSLNQEHRPIIGCITRLVPQKGIELIKQAIPYIVENRGQFVLLGQSPIPSINAEFHELKRIYTDHPHVHLFLTHQEQLAHWIYGGSDLFIVPSIFEPCGLTQLIALKYGTVPVVRRTGGLADTVFDVDHSKNPSTERNGYTFDDPTPKTLNSTLHRAINNWFNHPDRWRELMIDGMKMDYSWNKPADQYIEVYKNI